MKYKVWDDDEKHAIEVDALDEGHASEEFVGERLADMEYPETVDGIHVRNPEGDVSVWGVSVDWEPTFFSVEKKVPEGTGCDVRTNMTDE